MNTKIIIEMSGVWTGNVNKQQQQQQQQGVGIGIKGGKTVNYNNVVGNVINGTTVPANYFGNNLAFFQPMTGSFITTTGRPITTANRPINGTPTNISLPITPIPLNGRPLYITTTTGNVNVNVNVNGQQTVTGPPPGTSTHILVTSGDHSKIAHLSKSSPKPTSTTPTTTATTTTTTTTNSNNGNNNNNNNNGPPFYGYPVNMTLFANGALFPNGAAQLVPAPVTVVSPRQQPNNVTTTTTTTNNNNNNTSPTIKPTANSTQPNVTQQDTSINVTTSTTTTTTNTDTVNKKE